MYMYLMCTHMCMFRYVHMYMCIDIYMGVRPVQEKSKQPRVQVKPSQVQAYMPRPRPVQEKSKQPSGYARPSSKRPAKARVRR